MSAVERGESITPHSVDCLVLLDLDRTLFRSSDFNAAIQTCAVEEFDIPQVTIVAAQQEAEQEASFYSVDWVAKQLGEARFTAFVDRFLETNKDDFLYDDAKVLLDELEKMGMPTIAMTHGGKLGQVLKLLVAKIDSPYIIIDEPNKGERLRQWYDPISKRYIVVTDNGAVYRAKGFVLIDDKNRNFTGLDEDTPHALCIHVEGRARSGNDATPKIEVKKVDTLHAAPEMIWEYRQQLRAA